SDGWFFGDGTFDPLNDGASLTCFVIGGAIVMQLGGGLGSSFAFFTVGLAAANVGTYVMSTRPIRAECDNGVGLAMMSGTGVPVAGGNVGDLYFRKDGGALTTIYRCTV